MPYKTKKVGSKTCVYKKQGGKKVGCTTGPIKKYLGALHTHESKTNILDKMFNDIIKEQKNV